MCHLNVLIKEKSVEVGQILGLLNMVTLESYKTNKDGDGIFLQNPDLLVKSDKKLNLCNYWDGILKSNFILTHQRISTSGCETQFHQPFQDQKEDLVLIHNGIINDFKGDVGSDTYGYFYNYFIPKFKKLKGSRDKRIIKAVEETLKDCSGSYSIAIFDKKRNKLYYFKNSHKSINFYKTDDGKILYITTSYTNKDYLYFLKRKFSEMCIEDNKIYRVELGKKVKVKRVGKICKSPEKRTKKYVSVIRETDNYNNSYGWDRGRNYKRLPYDDGDKGLLDVFRKKSKENSDNIKRLMGDYLNKGVNRFEKLEEKVLNSYTFSQLGYMAYYGDGLCSVCGKNRGVFKDEEQNVICEKCLNDREECISEEELRLSEYLTYGVNEW